MRERNVKLAIHTKSVLHAKAWTPNAASSDLTKSFLGRRNAPALAPALDLDWVKADQEHEQEKEADLGSALVSNGSF